MADSTRAKHLEQYKWKPGECPNPAGRGKGSRNKLQEDFLADFHAAWREGGKDAIIKMRDEKPADFVRCAASLLPKQVEIKESVFDGVDDETLSAIVLAARAALSFSQDLGEGTSDQGKPN